MSFEAWRSARTELRQRAAGFERHERLREPLKARRSRHIRDVGPSRDLEQRVGSLREAAHREIARLWRELPYVFRPEDAVLAVRRVEQMARQHGWIRVGDFLRHEPERFGRLPGVGIAGWRSESRRAAQREAVTVARRVSRVGSIQREVGRERTELARNAPRAAVAEARLAKVNLILDMLPERRQQERALAELALRVDVLAAKLVLPKPIALPVAGALRLAGQWLLRERGRELGMGR